MKDIQTRHALIVKKILKQLVTDPTTQAIYLMWPNLVDVTLRFCNFVSPLMPSVSGETLVSQSIKAAISNYNLEKVEQDRPKSYVLGLLEHSAAALNGFDVHGVRENAVISWEPYIEPMVSWMARNQVLTIKTSPATQPRNKKIAKLAILVHIVTAQEMSDMRIDLIS